MNKNFEMLGIQKKWQDRLKELRISSPTPVQEAVIPLSLKGGDLVAQAQTGTGKTLAFLLPIVEQLDLSENHVQALVVTPTRELALQITQEAKKLTAGTQIRILAAYGGQDVEKQLHKLKGTTHLVIGTPGRLLDHLRRGTLNLKQIRILVLDEADQMLHMGFLPEVEAILKQTSPRHQTMLFSATMPDGVRKLAGKYTRKAHQISVKTDTITLEAIQQQVIETTDRKKQEALCQVLGEQKPFMAMIFCRTKRRAAALNAALQSWGYLSDELHGDLTQAKREKVMKSFRKAEIQLLVATDVAARGLDIDGVTHVYNYDMVMDPESYIHRIGRTGRAGEKGLAVTFVTPRDRDALHEVEKHIRMKLDRRLIGLEKHHTGNSSVKQEAGKSKTSGKGVHGKNTGNKKRGRQASSSKGEGRSHQSGNQPSAAYKPSGGKTGGKSGHTRNHSKKRGSAPGRSGGSR